MTEELIETVSSSKTGCILILISMITFVSTWSKKNHHSTDQRGNKVFHININFILPTYRVLISFSDDKFQLDLRGTEFGELIGFEKKLITKTEYGTKY